MPHFSLSDFDFTLPPELVAQHPAAERSASRLLDASTTPPTDRIFRTLPGLLRAGDLLVFNDTQVIKARLFGEKPTGGKVELLVERVLAGHEVVAHMKASKKPLPGTTLAMVGGSAPPCWAAGPTKTAGCSASRSPMAQAMTRTR